VKKAFEGLFDTVNMSHCEMCMILKRAKHYFHGNKLTKAKSAAIIP